MMWFLRHLILQANAIKLRIPPFEKGGSKKLNLMAVILRATLHSSHRQWSIRINNQWRICFEWQDNAAWNVAIVDYH